jgi:hypothetical protein
MTQTNTEPEIEWFDDHAVTQYMRLNDEDHTRPFERMLCFYGSQFLGSIVRASGSSSWTTAYNSNGDEIHDGYRSDAIAIVEAEAVDEEEDDA